jgi:nitroreductase
VARQPEPDPEGEAVVGSPHQPAPPATHRGGQRPASHGIDEAVVRRLVEAASRAPSGDNCQPWHFVWNGQHLEVLLARARSESFYDVQDLATWISLGAVLANIEIAARPLGINPVVSLFPAGPGADIVARIVPEKAVPAPEPLAASIEARCVNRRPYASTPIPADLRAELLGIGTAVDGVALHWVQDPPVKRRAACIAGAHDRILFEHRPLHQGLYRWLRWTAKDAARSGDGMPIASLELASFERPGFRLLGWWPLARALGAIGLTRALPVRATQVYRRSGAICLISTDALTPERFVQVGGVLQRVWLTATREGLALQPITGIAFLALRALLDEASLSRRHHAMITGLRDELARAFPAVAARYPAMLFRIGFAPPPSGRSLRRPVADILRVPTAG